MVFVDGILFREGVIERPGLTNFGQPFWGTDIFERAPLEAGEMAAAKGYVVRWQIEDRGGTQAADDDEIIFSHVAPPCGKIGGGSVVEDGRIQMVVVLDDPSTPRFGLLMLVAGRATYSGCRKVLAEPPVHPQASLPEQPDSQS